MAVKHFWPQLSQDLNGKLQLAAKYDPNGTPADICDVADRAEGVLTQVAFEGGRVLVAVFRGPNGDLRSIIVQPGEYLAYSTDEDLLYTTIDETKWRQFYAEVPDNG